MIASNYIALCQQLMKDAVDIGGVTGAGHIAAATTTDHSAAVPVPAVSLQQAQLDPLAVHHTVPQRSATAIVTSQLDKAPSPQVNVLPSSRPSVGVKRSREEIEEQARKQGAKGG